MMPGDVNMRRESELSQGVCHLETFTFMKYFYPHIGFHRNISTSIYFI